MLSFSSVGAYRFLFIVAFDFSIFTFFQTSHTNRRLVETYKIVMEKYDTAVSPKLEKDYITIEEMI